MKYKVKITDIAEKQVRGITAYISKVLLSPKAARSCLTKLKALTVSLNEIPHRFPLFETEPWRSDGIRKTLAGNFIVYFWIDEPTKTVWVTAVIYAKRDQLAALKDIPKQ